MSSFYWVLRIPRVQEEVEKSTQSPYYYCLSWSPQGGGSGVLRCGLSVHTTAPQRRFLYLKSNNSRGSRLVSQETKWQAGQQGGCRCSSAGRAQLPLTHRGQTAKTSICGTSAYQVKSLHLIFYSQAPNPPTPPRAHCVSASRRYSTGQLGPRKSGFSQGWRAAEINCRYNTVQSRQIWERLGDRNQTLWSQTL